MWVQHHSLTSTSTTSMQNLKHSKPVYCVDKENKRSRRREISGSKEDLSSSNEEEDDFVDDLAR